MTKIARFCGKLCIAGMIVGIVPAIFNNFFPNSAGSVATGDFVVLNPLMHRVEHFLAVVSYYPALCAGLFGFYAIGAVGRNWFGKFLLGLTAVGGALAISSSVIEAFVLQWEAADTMRAFGFVLLLLVLCPLLFGIAALVKRTVPLGLRIMPILLALIFIGSMIFIGLTKASETWAVAATFLAWAYFGYQIYNYSEAPEASAAEVA